MSNDRRLPPDQQAERIAHLIVAAGLTLERHGGAWRVHGYGVDILAAHLANLSPADLMPCHTTIRGEWDR